MTGEAVLEARIAAVRRFNRFYTQKIGALQEGLLHSAFSLTEARVLYELAQRDGVTATALAAALDLDPGYLSRILRGFEGRRLIERKASTSDARQSHVFLTPGGRAAFAPLDARSRAEIGDLLSTLRPDDQRRVVAAMRTIAGALGGEAEAPGPTLLREPRPGDLGWVVQRHGALYAQEYGFDETFEALVAEIVAKFVQHHEPQRERCWIAEQDGANVGSVFLVNGGDDTAKLRLFLVEPTARGHGVGTRLVDECLGFARRAGYRKVTLWTQSILVAARRIYQRSGFRLAAHEPHRSFGRDLVGENWEVTL